MLMLKKAIATAIALPICIGLGQSAIAEETGGVGGFSASVGVKAWINEWNYPIVFDEPLFSGSDLKINKEVTSFYSDTEVTFIPVFSLKYQNFFVSGSYFPKTTYSFQKQQKILFVVDENDVFHVGDNFIADGLATSVSWYFETEREEWDINVGYYLFPSLVVTAGYKKVDRVMDITSALFPGSESEISIESAINQLTDGFTLGIAGVAPLQGKFGLYGSFAFGWLETEEENELNQFLGANKTFDTNYSLGELGLMYSFRFEDMPVLGAASAYLGYRFQVLDKETDPESRDTTKGFVLGVNLVF